MVAPSYLATAALAWRAFANDTVAEPFDRPDASYATLTAALPTLAKSSWSSDSSTSNGTLRTVTVASSAAAPPRRSKMLARPPPRSSTSMPRRRSAAAPRCCLRAFCVCWRRCCVPAPPRALGAARGGGAFLGAGFF